MMSRPQSAINTSPRESYEIIREQQGAATGQSGQWYTRGVDFTSGAMVLCTGVHALVGNIDLLNDNLTTSLDVQQTRLEGIRVHVLESSGNTTLLVVQLWEHTTEASTL